ncbi:MAG TPA: hypothetical protein VFK92_11085 [Burkholderiales bacterium]|nr:hypothetical protein [Burkholderiales bacterium]
MRVLAAAAALLPAAAPGIANALDFDFTAARVEASLTADDNVTRAGGSDALRDTILGVRASKGLTLPVSQRTRAIVQGFVGGEKFHKYDGLSHNFFGAQADFQFRSSGEFGAATYSVFARTQAEYFKSDLRDGYRHAYGVTVLKPLTDRVTFLGALQQNLSDGRSEVFDNHNTALRGNFDWSLNNWNTVYASAEYRKGNFVSTNCRNCDVNKTLGLVNTAVPHIIQDDAFTDTIRDAYRIDANVIIATLGYNHAFGSGQSLDVSWRYATSSLAQPAVAPATKSDFAYTLNQFSLAYLVRF